MSNAKTTGLVRIECHGQVWFESPGRTEIIFKRLHIEHHYELSPKGFIGEDSESSQQDVRRRLV